MDFSFNEDAGHHHPPHNHHHPVDRRLYNAQPHINVDYDSLFSQVQELQASNYQQSSYIEELESRIQDLEATKLPAQKRRRVDNHDDNDDNDKTCAHCGQTLPEPAPATASMKQPQYGRRECPLTTERTWATTTTSVVLATISHSLPFYCTGGMIDGRSNAKLAFEEKCERLREFKAEFGHLVIGSNPPEKVCMVLSWRVVNHTSVCISQHVAVVSMVPSYFRVVPSAVSIRIATATEIPRVQIWRPQDSD